MDSDCRSSASRRAVLLRAFFTAIALAFVLFVPSHAFATGTVTLTSKEPDEADERWKLIRYATRDEFYDMLGVDLEGEDLLATGIPLTPEQELAYLSLIDALPI